jgi:hypothetical protein
MRANGIKAEARPVPETARIFFPPAPACSMRREPIGGFMSNKEADWKARVEGIRGKRVGGEPADESGHFYTWPGMRADC